MRRITLAEQQKLLEVIHRQEFGASMMRADAVCYGGMKEVEKYRDIDEHLISVIKAVPKDVLDAFYAAQRKAEADKLRAQADKVERGEA